MKEKEKKEREIAKELLREKFQIYYYHTEVQKWIIDRLEKYTYSNYRYYKRKMSYIEYITQLYIYSKGIKTIRGKFQKLLKDLRETQEKLYQKKNIVVKEGTRAWAALHLPPPSMSSMESFMDEIGITKPIWDDVYHGIYVKVSYIPKII